MPRQGGQLVADRLAAAGGQNREQAFAGITGADDVFLQRAAIRVLRLRAKGGVAEAAFQFLARIEMDRAIRAGRLVARGFPQAADQPGGLGKLPADPGRQHRIAAADAQPGQHIGKGMAGCMVGERLGDDLPQLVRADLGGDQRANQAADFPCLRRHGAPHGGKKVADAALAIPAQEEMQAGQFGR